MLKKIISTLDFISTKTNKLKATLEQQEGCTDKLNTAIAALELIARDKSQDNLSGVSHLDIEVIKAIAKDALLKIK